jgi:hypothetical protein
LVISVVATFLAAAAMFAVTLAELNVARDPENLDGAIYCTTVYGMNLRAGPGTYFAVLGTVPAGAEVPVVGWVSTREKEEGFWVRTWYEGQRGWLCAYADGERLLERDGGPLFTLTAKEDIVYDYGTRRPAPGAEIEFTGLEELSWTDFLKWDGYVHLHAKYGGKDIRLCAYEAEDIPKEPTLFYPRPPAASGEGWTVDFDPAFLELNLTYNYERCDFAFTESEVDVQGRRGPGYEYAEVDDGFICYSIIFIEDGWALAVEMLGTYGWIPVGTEGEPDIRIYRIIPYERVVRAGIRNATEAMGVYGDWDKWVRVYDDYWPGTDDIYVEFREPYFSTAKDKTKISGAAFYQPPDAKKPLAVKAAGEGEKSGWHETVILAYSFKAPQELDRDAPFRIAAKMLYEDEEEFEVDFHCNPSRDY